MRIHGWKRAAALLCTAAAVLLTGCGQTRMMFGTGGTAGTYYAYGGVLAQYMTNYSDGKVTAGRGSLRLERNQVLCAGWPNA